MADSTEGINFKLVTTGRVDVDARKPSNFNVLTYTKLCRWIDEKSISQSLKDELKKMASTYPQQALPKWVKAFPKHLITAQDVLSKRDSFIVKPELGDEPESETYEEAPRFDEFD